MWITRGVIVNGGSQFEKLRLEVKSEELNRILFGFDETKA
jgi:hypothetical protein